MCGCEFAARVVQVPKEVAMLQASHDPVQALSQQVPSGEQVVPLAHPPPTVWQVCPCLLLHAPVASHVPAHTPGSSWFLTAVHTPFVHVWQAPAQSLRFVHPTHWLLVMSHVAAVPAQYLFAVQATHWPLVAQAGVPGRPPRSPCPRCKGRMRPPVARPEAHQRPAHRPHRL